jgi:type II secretory ATPase GspE/PulE/Tfp pilus assembly ATPase PilB-like protein
MAMRYPPLLIQPVWFAVLAGWVFLWLHCVTSMDRHFRSSGKARPYLNLAVLLTGPFGWLAWWTVSHRLYTTAGWQSGLVVLARHLGWGKRARRYDEDLVTVLAHSDGRPIGEDVSLSRGRGEAMALTLARQMIDWAVKLRASDLFLDPKPDQSYELRYRVDGLLRSPERVEKETALATINCLKVIADMNIAERRRAQDGSLLAFYDDREIKLRVATAGTVYGEKMVIRVLDAAVGLFRLDQLGLSPKHMGVLRQQIHRPYGMILACGPTGSGKSTTLYAAISELGGSGRNIITIEDPIEYTLPIASQTAVNVKAGISFATQLRHVLRQSPDVIMIGEIRDAETARIALQASETGHLVFSTLHSNDAITGLIRLIELGIEPHLIATSVACVLSQRLVRKLCPRCRSKAVLSERLRREATNRRIPLDQVYEPSGCAACDRTGYVGREAVFEILEMTPEMGEKLAARPSAAGLREIARAHGVTSLRQDAVAKLLNGTTSMAEVIRVTGN